MYLLGRSLKLPVKDMRHFRWQVIVESVVTALHAAHPSRLRTEVEEAIRRAEQIVSKSEPSRLQPDEPRDYRVREFRAELRSELVKRLRDEPSNQAWREAITLLDNPWLQVAPHRRPAAYGDSVL
jgi:hypothetical protein